MKSISQNCKVFCGLFDVRAFEGDLSEITTLCDAENLREVLVRKVSRAVLID